MTVVTEISGMKVLAVVGKLGLPNGLGAMVCGITKLGDDFQGAGIYRRNGRWHNQKIVRMKHYRPHNPQTIPQQARRATFSNGVGAWHLLSENEKDDLRTRAKLKHISGFNLHMREYMASA